MEIKTEFKAWCVRGPTQASVHASAEKEKSARANPQFASRWSGATWTRPPFARGRPDRGAAWVPPRDWAEPALVSAGFCQLRDVAEPRVLALRDLVFGSAPNTEAIIWSVEFRFFGCPPGPAHDGFSVNDGG